LKIWFVVNQHRRNQTEEYRQLMARRFTSLIISGAVKDEHIELQFSDNCGGIALENLDKIFEPFFTTKPAG